MLAFIAIIFAFIVVAAVFGGGGGRGGPGSGGGIDDHIACPESGVGGGMNG